MKIFGLIFTALSAMAAFSYSSAQAADNEKFHVHVFGQPPGFDTLDAFIRSNWEDSLDSTTLKQTTVDGQPAMTFWTDAGGIREFNLLIKGQEEWILMTSAQLDFTRDDPSRAGTISTEDTRGGTSKSLETIKAMTTVIASSVFSSPCMTPGNSDNCVSFVRCLAPWLAPKVDLTTYAAKKNLINSLVPKIGEVAVIPVTGLYAANGHLAYVIAVNYAGGQISTISIVESHYAYPNGFDVRTDTPAHLNIAGYVTH